MAVSMASAAPLPTEIKLAILGSKGVGKTAFASSYVQGEYVDRPPSPPVEPSMRKVFEDGTGKCILDITDFPAEDWENFKEMRDLHMRTSNGFILAFSLTDRSSLDYLHGVRHRILTSKDTDARKVTVEQGQTLGRTFDCPYLETSSTSRINIDEVFATIVRQFQMMRAEDTDGEKRKEAKHGCVVM